MDIQRSLSRCCGATLLAVAVIGSVTGCKEEKPQPPPEAEAKGKPDQPTTDPPKKEKPQTQPLALGHRFPVGPRLVFLPGKGAGAIRFGATVETIERHMGAPCDSKTEERCLYVRGAVEFFLKEGVLDRIKAHRRDRKVTSPPKGKDKYYGSLRGIVQPRIMMGLHRHIVLEEFGEPKTKEPVNPAGPDGLVDRHTYDGLVLEYDKIANGNVVLAGIEVMPSETPYEPPVKKGALAVPPGALKDPAPKEQRAR